MTQTKPTIVLVHGAWADGSSWTKVVERLHAAGHDAITLPNTLRGGAADAAVIRSYLDTIDGPVVLVAHSYGGFVITNAAKGAANVKALVYVDAFIPDEGQNAAVLASQASVLTAALSDPTKVFKLVPIPGAPPDVLDTYLLPQVVSGSFANDVSAEEAKLDPCDAAACLARRPPRAIRTTGLEGHPGVGRDRHTGPDHPAGRAACDGEERRRADHRSRRLARVDGVAPADRDRGHRGGAPGGGAAAASVMSAPDRQDLGWATTQPGQVRV